MIFEIKVACAIWLILDNCWKCSISHNSNIGIAQENIAQTEKVIATGRGLEQNSEYSYRYMKNYVILDPGNTSLVPYRRILDELGW